MGWVATGAAVLSLLLGGAVLEEVNPRIGTGGAGYGVGGIPLAAQVPFGMVRLGPDTDLRGLNILWRHPGGYHHDDTHIRRFSHLHTVGAGVLDYGNLGLLPVDRINDAVVSGESFRFHHESEELAPGYYAVTLHSPQIRAELTATANAGVHRYHWPPSARRAVLFDLSHAVSPGAVTDSEVWVEGDEVRGWLRNEGDYTSRYGGFRLYFVANFDAVVVDKGVWSPAGIVHGGEQARGKSIGAYVDFGAADQPVELAVGLSFISFDDARRNLKPTRRGFDAVRETASKRWADLLGRVEISGGTVEQRRVFSTALYHSFLSPTRFTENGGRYLGFDRKVHVAEGWHYYSDLSLWDTFRTLHPLLTMVAPVVQRDVIRSLLAMREEGGDLPRWPMGPGYTGGMIGTHADVVIADTYLKGVVDFDVESAYRAIREHAMEPRRHGGRSGIDSYRTLGYCPEDEVSKGACHTLEYAYDDWAIANLADELGRTSDAAIFRKRAGNFAHVWDAGERFFRGRLRDGSWVEPLRSLDVFDEQYVEGDAWQWRWFAPHDGGGLARLFGSSEQAVRALSTFFRRSAWVPGTLLPDPYYWHGNEPDIHAAYLFSDWGRPDLTQYWARWVMKTKYGEGPAGLDGNDDYGTLSSWFVWSAAGLYPLAGSTRYTIGSPLFDEVRFSREEGDLVVVAHGAGPGQFYVQAAALNGESLDGPFVEHDDIRFGAILELWMGNSPSGWGR